MFDVIITDSFKLKKKCLPHLQTFENSKFFDKQNITNANCFMNCSVREFKGVESEKFKI